MSHKTMPAASRSALASLGLLALTLGLAACGSTPSPKAQAPQAGGDFVYDGGDYSWSSDGQPSLKPLAITSGDNGLTYETWTAATNGWGPIEMNTSVGEKGSRDGRTLSIGGVTYDKGFGAHSSSSMTFSLGRQCSTFTASVGMDDEVGSRGSVVFQVYADGTKVYDSGKMTGADGARAVQVSVSGKNELKLVVTDAGDGIAYDHANWANPMLLGCTATAGTPPVASPPVAAPSENIVYSGPIVITKGGTYSGNWENTANKGAVLIQTSEPVIIENSNIRGRGNLISGFRNRLTLRNVRGYGLNPNVAGKTPGRAVNAQEIMSLRVENSYFENTTGIYVTYYMGDPGRDTIKILRNKFKNINGMKSDGAGGYTKDTSIVQAIQFNSVRRLPGVEIAWNEIINEPGKSRPEENINIIGSSGTPQSPMLIHDNYIQGAYPVDPATNTDYPGGGILVGDGKVTDPLDNGYTRVYNNQIVGTTNHALAVPGGVDQQVYNNRAVASGRLPDGTRIPAMRTGAYVWDIWNAGALTPPTFARNSMRDNEVGWTRVRSDGSTSNSPFWWASCSTNGTTCTGNKDLGTITLDMERQEYQRWLDKVAAAGVKVGP